MPVMALEVSVVFDKSAEIHMGFLESLTSDLERV
jgi:hypothetical protein